MIIKLKQKSPVTEFDYAVEDWVRTGEYTYTDIIFNTSWMEAACWDGDVEGTEITLANEGSFYVVETLDQILRRM